jgi:hypothetical protein
MALSHQQKEMLLKLALFGVSQVMFYFTFKWMVKQMDPNRNRKQNAHIVVCLVCVDMVAFISSFCCLCRASKFSSASTEQAHSTYVDVMA